MDQLQRFNAIEAAMEIRETHKQKLAHMSEMSDEIRARITSEKTWLMAIELHMKQLREGKTPEPIEDIYQNMTK